eukprot:jgi/Mesvir1/22927/Mv19443-RA.3
MDTMAVDPARVVRPQPISEDLVCNICTGVLQDPVEGPCEHLACRECLDGWLQRSDDKTCPTCRQRLMPDTIKQAHRVVRNQLDAMEVTCDNAARGCPAVVALGALRNHLVSCGKAIGGCPNDGCDATVLREDRENHLQACSHRIVPCSRCNASVKHQDKEAHLRTTCPAVEVACQHNGGCRQTVRRDAMATHVATECSRAMVTCAVPGCQRQVVRGDMRAHLQDSMAEHMASLSVALQQANSKIAAQDAELEKLKTSATTMAAVAEHLEGSLAVQMASLSLSLQLANAKIAAQDAELAKLKAAPVHVFHCVAALRGPKTWLRCLAEANGVLYSVEGTPAPQVNNGFTASIWVWNLKDHTSKKALDLDQGYASEMSKLTVDRTMLYALQPRVTKAWRISDYQPVDGNYADFHPTHLADLISGNDGKIYVTLDEGTGRLVPGSKGTRARIEKFEGGPPYARCLEIHGTLLYGGCAFPPELNRPEKLLVKVWDTTSKKLVRNLEAPGTGNCVTALALGNGAVNALATDCDRNATVLVWTAKNYSNWPTELCDHKAAVPTRRLAMIVALLVHDGMLISGSSDGQIKMWRIPAVDAV